MTTTQQAITRETRASVERLVMIVKIEWRLQRLITKIDLFKITTTTFFCLQVKTRDNLVSSVLPGIFVFTNDSDKQSTIRSYQQLWQSLYNHFTFSSFPIKKENARSRRKGKNYRPTLLHIFYIHAQFFCSIYLFMGFVRNCKLLLIKTKA